MRSMMLMLCLCIAALTVVGCRQSPQPGQTTPAPTQNNADDSNKTDADPPRLKGVDVSHYQPEVDFQALKKAGYTFVFVKATQGDDFLDPLFQTHFNQASEAGLVVGAYHFYMTDDQPQSQFDNYSRHVTLKKDNLSPVVDIESLHDQDSADLDEKLHHFLKLLETHYGVKPIIYSGESFSNQYLQTFGDYPLWLAEYHVDTPTIPQGWSSWAFWQYTQSGTIAGVAEKLDLSYFQGDRRRLQNYLIPE